jgi:hypothetical protein
VPFAGITYKVKPGFEDEIAWIFSPENFTRVDSPILRDEDGEELGYLTCTGLFIEDDTMIRVIQHEGGTAADIRRHMSVQEGVHEAETRLVPYLAAERDTTTPEGFMAHFDRSAMTVLGLDQVDNRPAAGLVAVRYRIRPTPVAVLAEAYAAAPSIPVDGDVVATLLLVKDDSVVRVVQYEGGRPEAAEPYLADEAWLTPFAAATPLTGQRMRCLSHLSAAVTG